VAVGGVDADHVASGRQESLDPGLAVGDAHGPADPQAPEMVLAGVGVLLDLLDVLDRDQTLEAEVIVDDEQLLDPVLVKKPLRVLEADGLRHRDELVLGHDAGDGLFEVGLEAEVPVGQDPHQLTPFHHGNAGNLVAAHELEGVLHLLLGPDRDGVHDHAAFRFLYLVDLEGLALDAHIAVDDPDASLARHADCGLRFRHGIHGGADDGDVHNDAVGQVRLRIHVLG